MASSFQIKTTMNHTSSHVILKVRLHFYFATPSLVNTHYLYFMTVIKKLQVLTWNQRPHFSSARLSSLSSDQTDVSQERWLSGAAMSERLDDKEVQSCTRESQSDQR